MIRTDRPLSVPAIRSAALTAAQLTETPPAPTAVSCRAFLPVRMATAEDVKSLAKHTFFPRGINGRFDLPQNLVFTQHHRFQAAGHPQKMRNRVTVFIGIKIFCQFLRRGGGKRNKLDFKEGLKKDPCDIRDNGMGVDFGTVTGG